MIVEFEITSMGYLIRASIVFACVRTSSGQKGNCCTVCHLAVRMTTVVQSVI